MKITYYVQRYRPSFEAISKEVRALAEHFSNSNIVRIHDLHLDGITKIRIDKKVVSYHFMYYLLTAPFVNIKAPKTLSIISILRWETYLICPFSLRPTPSLLPQLRVISVRSKKELIF